LLRFRLATPGQQNPGQQNDDTRSHSPHFSKSPFKYVADLKHNIFQVTYSNLGVTYFTFQEAEIKALSGTGGNAAAGMAEPTPVKNPFVPSLESQGS
jgi:hypothetical protein